MIDTLDNRDAQLTVRDMVCSICWGSLVMDIAPAKMYSVKCRKCGDATKGYVSKAQAERRAAESKAELIEVKRAYPELAGEDPKPPMSTDETVKQLGF